MIDKLYDGLSEIRETISDSVASDREIKDALWYYYLDVEKALNWILGKSLQNLSTLHLIFKFVEESNKQAQAEKKKKEKGMFLFFIHLRFPFQHMRLI